ncbi:MAG: DUF1570 domain-containing protein, partial [Planctomycetes bacterium]|nr:DUF1570 domain-containing protein [Planctomycetota bacterium]
MRYCLIPLTLLLAGIFCIASASHAEYLIIRVAVKPAGVAAKGVGAAGGNIGMPPQGFKPGEYITAVVEAKGYKQELVKGLGNVQYIEHKWGRTAYFEDRQEIMIQRVPTQLIKSPAAQYVDKLAQLTKGKDRSTERYYELAYWCLEIGLPDKCMSVLESIDKTVTASKDPTAAPKKVAAALEAYKKIKPILVDDIAKLDRAEEWKSKLRFKNDIKTSKHYAIVFSDDLSRDDAQRRLDALEHNFKCFYLLFALKGKALSAPTEKMVGVLVSDAAILRKIRQAFEIPPLVSDGLYARNANVVLFPSFRLDDVSRVYDQMMRETYRAFGNELLNGKFSELGRKEDVADRSAKIARAQVLALVDAALREEAEIASATHEGTRQLLAETGLLPRDTAAPEWLRFGLASLFEMPKGPYPGKSTSLVKQSFYPGAGGPNWAWRRYLDEMMQDGSFADPPIEVLANTLINHYFDNAAVLAARPKTMEYDPAIASENELARGRCLAWSLTFYLFNNQFTEFMSFLAELGNQPRDVEFDNYSFLTTFCKSFKIDTAGLTPAQYQLKPERYTDFATKWIAELRLYPTPTVQMNLDVQVDPKDPNGK